MKPKFSVIIPLYNKAPYIRKALESVRAQTFTDWECILVDDGSTDRSINVAKDYISLFENEDLRLKILTQPNAGVSAARNRGVAESQGEYVCFLDADDWWEPTFLEEMDQLIREYTDAGIYCTNYIYYKPGKTHVALRLPRGYMDYPKTYYEQEAMPIWTGATCMPRNVFEEMGGFPEGVKMGEDFLLWAKTAIHYKVAFCEKPLAYYNNDVPVSLRATRNLHAPEYHMLFHLASLEQEIEHLSLAHSWKQLLDKLRVSGLMNYWLSTEYHEAATVELSKVDWSKQPRSAKAQYEKPIWYLKAKRRFMQTGSWCKQKLIGIW